MFRRRLTFILFLALVGGACGQDDPPGETTDQPSATVTVPTTTAPPPAEAPAEAETGSAGVEALEAITVRLTEVATLDAPVAMAQRPGHESFFVAERAGRIMVLEGDEVRPEPLLEVETTTDGERGLLGLAFSPDGARLYVSYTNLDGDSRLDEYAMGEGVADIDLASRRNVLAVGQPYSNHNGGHIVFGPDELLYYGLGDGGGSGDPEGNAQDTTTLLGSVLRLDPRRQDDAPYAIPAGNPFVSSEGRAEILLYGVRNPWRFSFDRATGDLWLADVGQNAVEEVNRLPAGEAVGANLGWPALEGTRPYDGDPPPNAVAPVYDYTHDDGYSVTGGFVYRGRAIPALAGAYVFGDLGTAQLWALAVDGDGGVAGRADLGVGVDQGTLVSFFEDVDGELYVISIGGTISRLDPA
jgi:glucose/arabinose dehydrogenase